MTRLNKTLSIVLGLTVLVAVAALIYVVTVAEPRDAFTEFYVLGPSGKATDYPTQLKLGEEGAVTLVIVNWEHEVMSYQVEIEIDGFTKSKLGPIVLEHGGRFERIVSFAPEKSGKEQKVEFLLYSQRQSGIYSSLHLLVDVED